MANESQWRRVANDVIDSVFGMLPRGATITDVRRALRLAYPFGEKKYHPYKMWLKVVRVQLKARGFGHCENPEREPAIVLLPMSHPYVASVRCDFCPSRERSQAAFHSCMYCSDQWDRIRHVNQDRERIKAWMRGAETDPLILAQVCDYFWDRGLEELVESPIIAAMRAVDGMNEERT